MKFLIHSLIIAAFFMVHCMKTKEIFLIPLIISILFFQAGHAIGKTSYSLNQIRTDHIELFDKFIIHLEGK